MSSARIPIDGTYNFRDLGGFRAGSSITREGVFYRSDALGEVSDTGLDELASRGVVSVVDLRSPYEQTSRPDRVPAGAELVDAAIFSDVGSHVTGEVTIDALTELIYLQHGDTLASAIAHVAAPESGSVVFHCTAGKDRTGAVAALSLLAVGVERDDVMHDYAASEANLSGAWLDAQLAALGERGTAPSPILVELLGGTPVTAIDRALALVEREYGSVRDYLRAHRVADVTIERLGERLVG